MRRRNKSGSPSSSAERRRRELYDDFVDSDDEGRQAMLDDSDDESLGGIDLGPDDTTSRRSKRATPFASKSASPSPSHHQLDGSLSPLTDEGDEDDSFERRKRTTKQPKQYRFAPKMYRSSQPQARKSAAEAAGIKTEPAGKFDISSLLLEKKRKEKRGTDLKGIDDFLEQAAEWERRPMEEDTAGMKKALKDLEDVHVARAQDGMHTDEDDDDDNASDEDEEVDVELSDEDDYAETANWDHCLQPQIAPLTLEPSDPTFTGDVTRLQPNPLESIGSDHPTLKLLASLQLPTSTDRLNGLYASGALRSALQDREAVTAALSHDANVLQSLCNGLVKTSFDHPDSSTASTVIALIPLVAKVIPNQSSGSGYSIGRAVQKAFWSAYNAKALMDEVQPGQTKRHLAHRLLEITQALARRGSLESPDDATALLHLLVKLSSARAVGGGPSKPYMKEVIEDCLAVCRWPEASRWLEPWSDDSHSILTRHAWLGILRALPNTSNKSRIIKRSQAYRLLFGQSTESRARPQGPILPSLASICQSLESSDPQVNPLFISTSASTKQTDYHDFEANVALLEIVLADLALQLCRPPDEQTEEGAVLIEASRSSGPNPGQEMPAPTCPSSGDSSKEVDKRLPTLHSPDQPTAVPASSPLSSVPSSLAIPPSSSLTTPPSSAATPVASSQHPAATPAASSSGATLPPNQAFRIAVGPYATDVELLEHFKLDAATTFRPQWSRVRSIYRLLTILRSISAKVPEGRGLNTAASNETGCTPLAAGKSKTASPKDAMGLSASLNLGKPVSSHDQDDLLVRSRVKDALMRLNMAIHYQCESYTGRKIGGDIIDDEEDGDEEEAIEEENEAHAEPMETKSGAEASAIDDQSVAEEVEEAKPPQQATPAQIVVNGTAATPTRPKAADPRSSDQRTLTHWFTPKNTAR